SGGDWLSPNLRLVGVLQSLRATLAARRYNGRTRVGGRGALGHAGRMRTAIHPASVWIRSGDIFGAVRGNAGRRHRTHHLFLGRPHRAARHVAANLRRRPEGLRYMLRWAPSEPPTHFLVIVWRIRVRKCSWIVDLDVAGGRDVRTDDRLRAGGRLRVTQRVEE